MSTYTQSLGRSKAAVWLLLGTLLCVLCAVPIIDALQQREIIAYALLLPAASLVLVCALREVAAKKVEGSTSLLLLMSFVAFGVSAW